jgi:hypothetical protein
MSQQRYSLVATQNVVLVTDDVAKRIVDTFTPEQSDAAASYVADLNNGDVDGRCPRNP